MKHLINGPLVSVRGVKKVKKPESEMRRNYFSLTYFKSFKINMITWLLLRMICYSVMTQANSEKGNPNAPIRS